MAKDILISGSTYTGVERVYFQTPSGGKVSFVDSDTKKAKETICAVSCHAPAAFACVATVPQAVPATTISYVLGV